MQTKITPPPILSSYKNIKFPLKALSLAFSLSSILFSQNINFQYENGSNTGSQYASFADGKLAISES